MSAKALKFERKKKKKKSNFWLKKVTNQMAFSVPPVDSISKYYAVVVVRLLVRFSRDDTEKKR